MSYGGWIPSWQMLQSMPVQESCNQCAKNVTLTMQECQDIIHFNQDFNITLLLIGTILVLILGIVVGMGLTFLMREFRRDYK